MFSEVLQKHREYASGEGINSVVYAFKNVGLRYCTLHETSLANNFYSTLLGRREGYVKRVLSLYACENAENYGWSLNQLISRSVWLFLCLDEWYTLSAYALHVHLSNHIPYSGKLSRTIIFTVFKDFTTTLKINSSKSYYSIESYDSLVDLRNLIHEIYCGEITLKIFCFENYLLYGILDRLIAIIIAMLNKQQTNKMTSSLYGIGKSLPCCNIICYKLEGMF